MCLFKIFPYRKPPLWGGLVGLLLPFFSFGQFAPPVGQIGTSAMYKDSSAFIGWADFCIVQRGFQDISNKTGPRASVGDSSKAIGISDNSVVSLGDSGVAICTFQKAITDGTGYDFAVFENSFNDDYLEFAFVEVSSDGTNFFRFPATSNIQDSVQTGSFGSSDATLVNNLAGKYRALYGTPFDLSELQGTTGLDINHVTHVKIIDVGGSIAVQYATYDKNNHKVNDPWPTAFPSGGFDLDAIGVINQSTNSIKKINMDKDIVLYPNPATSVINIQLPGMEKCGLTVYDLKGEIVFQRQIQGPYIFLNVTEMKFVAGVYFFKINTGEAIFTKKIIITE